MDLGLSGAARHLVLMAVAVIILPPGLKTICASED